jgi:hypothetical protein
MIIWPHRSFVFARKAVPFDQERFVSVDETQIDWSRCDGFDHDFDDIHESLTVEEMRQRIRTTGSTLPAVAVEKSQTEQAKKQNEAKP